MYLLSVIEQDISLKAQSVFTPVLYYVLWLKAHNTRGQEKKMATNEVQKNHSNSSYDKSQIKLLVEVVAVSSLTIRD